MSSSVEFLGRAVQALPYVAGSPLALIGYLAAIGSWVTIAWRVNRNKQLLRNIDKLPQKDRLKALQMEMGGVPVAKGLTPEQWLLSRIHRYYFLGFLVICVLAAILFAIASYKGSKAATPGVSVNEALAFLDIGASRDLVTAKLGVPRSVTKFEASTCADYLLDEGYIQVLYDSSDHVAYYLVMSRDRQFHPHIPITYKLLREPCLGCVTFSELGLEGQLPEPVYFNYSAHLYTYTEALPYSFRASAGKIIYATYSGAGFDFGSSPIATDLLDQYANGKTRSDAVAKNTQNILSTFRDHTRPNAFGVISDEYLGGIQVLTLPPYLNLPAGGGERDCAGRLADVAFDR